MKTPLEIKLETEEKLSHKQDLLREQTLKRLEGWMRDIPQDGKSSEWYEGYDKTENAVIATCVLDELKRNGWKGSFRRTQVRMHSMFSGKSAGWGTLVILTVVPL